MFRGFLLKAIYTLTELDYTRELQPNKVIFLHDTAPKTFLFLNRAPLFTWKFPMKISRNGEAYLEPCQACKMRLLGRYLQSFSVNHSRKKLHLRCLTGFWIRIHNMSWSSQILFTNLCKLGDSSLALRKQPFYKLRYTLHSIYIQWSIPLMILNSFMTEASIIKKPAHWFALQINELVF